MGLNNTVVQPGLTRGGVKSDLTCRLQCGTSKKPEWRKSRNFERAAEKRLVLQGHTLRSLVKVGCRRSCGQHLLVRRVKKKGREVSFPLARCKGRQGRKNSSRKFILAEKRVCFSQGEEENRGTGGVRRGRKFVEALRTQRQQNAIRSVGGGNMEKLCQAGKKNEGAISRRESAGVGGSTKRTTDHWGRSKGGKKAKEGEKLRKRFGTRSGCAPTADWSDGAPSFRPHRCSQHKTRKRVEKLKYCVTSAPGRAEKKEG